MFTQTGMATQRPTEIVIAPEFAAEKNQGAGGSTGQTEETLKVSDRKNICQIVAFNVENLTVANT